MKPRTLILTVGLPRSGKSTWSMEQGVPVVNPDSIRLGLHGKTWEPLAEPFVWATARLMVRALFLAGHQVVILDATNLTRRRRAEWDDDLWEAVYQVFDVPAHECIRRAEYGGRGDLVPVITRMAPTLQGLRPDERAWDYPITWYDGVQE